MVARWIVILTIMVLAVVAEGSDLRKIHRIDTFGSNVFLIETESSLFMIDAGYPRYADKILKKINELHKKLTLIVITHGHFDHYGCAAQVKRVTGAPVAIHEFDTECMCKGTTPLDSVNFIGFFGRAILPLAEKIFPPDCTCPDILLHDGDLLDNYGLKARIILTPGHTKGSCCIIVEDSIAFAGDLLINTLGVFDRQAVFANSWGQIDASIDRLCRADFSEIYIGHTGKTCDKKKLLQIATRR